MSRRPKYIAAVSAEHERNGWGSSFWRLTMTIAPVSGITSGIGLVRADRDVELTVKWQGNDQPDGHDSGYHEWYGPRLAVKAGTGRDIKAASKLLAMFEGLTWNTSPKDVLETLARRGDVVWYDTSVQGSTYQKDPRVRENDSPYEDPSGHVTTAIPPAVGKGRSAYADDYGSIKLLSCAS